MKKPTSVIRTNSEFTDTEQMNGKIFMEGKLHPGNELAIARTVLANERTLMTILRTALGSFIGGASLLKFFGHPAYEFVGIVERIQMGGYGE